jgi:hypothetical protein
MAVLDRYIVLLHNALGLPPGLGWRIGKHDDLPTCTEALRGYEYRVEGGAGVADRRVVCAKDAADAYDWVDL